MRPRRSRASSSIAQYNLSRLLDRLEVKGLIERKEYEGDARGQLIALTPKGRALQKEMWPAYREAVKKQLNALTKHQIEDLSKLLCLLIRKEGG